MKREEISDDACSHDISVLLILASQRINYDSLFGGGGGGVIGLTANESLTSQDSVDRKERRGPPPTPVEWAIIVWVSQHKDVK